MNRILRAAAAVLAGFCLIGGQLEVHAAEEEAAIIRPESSSILSGDGDVSVILDGSRWTKWRSQAGKAEFTLPEPAYALYLEWDYAPESWTLTADSVASEVGTNQFIHSYMELDTPASKFSMSWEGDATLSRMYFLTEGTAPDFVQIWEPPCEKADFLLLPTHADDELLWFGGVMPLYAGEKDLEVQIAYMVNHDTEPYRLHEQLDGLWHVGVENYPIIPEFPDIYSPSIDHARTIYNQDEIIAYQVGLIRRFQPSVIVSQDLNGEYGHGAHRLNAYCLTQSVELAADAAEYPDIPGVWDTPKTYYHLYPENQIVMNWDEPLEYFDGKTAFQAAQDGFACHASQTKYFAVQQSGPYDCRKFGLYRSTVGPDTEADMTQNLPEPEPEPEPEPSSEPESSVPESSAESSEPSASSASASSQPESSESSISEDNNGSFGPQWIFIIGFAVLTIIIVVAAIIRRNKSKGA